MKIEFYKYLKETCKEVGRKRIVAMIFVMAILAIPFAIFQHYELWSPIDTEIMGQYGDFYGGVFSTIFGLFSIVLLYKTLVSQNKEAKNNAEVYVKQQIHDRYFHIVSMYRDIIESLKLKDDGITYTGKEALSRIVDTEFALETSSENIATCAITARRVFQRIYSSETHFAPIYFRTLYRIMDMLDRENVKAKKEVASEISDRVVELIKMMRAQLSPAELLLLKYNSVLPQGKKFARLIDKYNLLKHLPPLNLFEYSSFVQKLTPYQVGLANSLLLELKKDIAFTINYASEGDNSTITSSKSGCHFNVWKVNDRLNISLVLNAKRKCSDDDRFIGFETLGVQEAGLLLKLFVYDCFFYSQYSALNNRKDFVCSYETPDEKRITLVAYNKSGKSLRLKIDEAQK